MLANGFSPLENAQLCISISAFAIHFYYRQCKYLLRCFLHGFFFVSSGMYIANNSFEFRMSWNRKLVILDSGNHRFRFVARHSYCCCCCCGVSVPFFFDKWPVRCSHNLQVYNIRRANIQLEWERDVPFLLARMSCVIVMHVCVHLQRVSEWANVCMSVSLTHSFSPLPTRAVSVSSYFWHSKTPVCVFAHIPELPQSIPIIMNGKNSVHEWLQPNKLIQNDNNIYTYRSEQRYREKKWQ